MGGSYSQGDVVADPVTPGLDPAPKGLEGTSGTGYEFFPGVYVNGTRRRWGAQTRKWPPPPMHSAPTGIRRSGDSDRE